MTKLWLAWEDDGSIRSQVLSRALDAEFRAFTCFNRSKTLKWLRYPVATVQTFWELLRQRPALLVVQNPSILLAYETSVLRLLFRYRLVIDLHTNYTQPTGVKKLIAETLTNYGFRHCNAVVVTNEASRAQVAGKTSRPVLVLPDKIPTFDSEFVRVDLRGAFNVLYICTFSQDEPWQEVMNAAAHLPAELCLYISGRNRIPQEQVPANVVLTGYLPRVDYQNLLRSVDAVMVLTTAEDCLVCGGYEAVAAGKPLILSDTLALRSFFHQGTVFTENHGAAIAQAICRARDTASSLVVAIAALKDELDAAWQKSWQVVLEQLGAVDDGTDQS